MVKRKRLSAAARRGRQKKKDRQKAFKAIQGAKLLQQARKSKATKQSRIKDAALEYIVRHPILVVGDGDFSFSVGLVKLLKLGGGKASYITATSLDSREEVLTKYGRSAEVNLEVLEKSCVSVLHRVDATKLQEYFHCVSGKREIGDPSQTREEARGFGMIIFNFPHTGKQRVHANRALVRDFLLSALGVVSANGEVHITIKDHPPYSLWGVESIAAENGWRTIGTRSFEKANFVGYHHRTTEKEAKKFDASHCLTYIFMKKQQLQQQLTDSSTPPIHTLSRKTTLQKTKKRRQKHCVDQPNSTKATLH